jgi:DNA-binding transcriptional LysR family regulator
MDPPPGEPLIRYAIFPVCAPSIAAGRKNPLRAPADLARHVMLDYDTILYGKPWSDWERWLETMGMRDFRPAGSMRFRHYDQAIDAAMAGGGIAIGKWPHTLRELRDGALIAPFGTKAVARLGGYYPVIRPDVADSPVVQSFIGWLRAEVERDRAFRADAPAPRHAPAARRNSDKREAVRAPR